MQNSGYRPCGSRGGDIRLNPTSYEEDQHIVIASWGTSAVLGQIPGEVVVVIPSVDIQAAQKTARVLLRRSGLECSVLIFHDDLSRGYVNTINHCFRLLNNPFVVYTAEDAFPGRLWLHCAFLEMINGGLGLVSFNDGKWGGKVASFGLVRRDWVETLYGGNLFFGEYKRHAADNELTAIARFQGRYKYSPQAVLLEIDFDKPWTNKTDPNDWALFVNRLSRGFYGVLTKEGVEAELKLYSRLDSSTCDIESTQGRFDKHEVLSLIHEVVNPKFYFEIGVQHGYSLALAKCPALGVDPAPVLKVKLPPTTKVVRLTSDDFFSFGLNSSCLKPELVFIDGMHLSEHVLRDLVNVIRWANTNLVVVIDDIFPNNNAQGQRVRTTRHWAGDVWKVADLLVKNCPSVPKLFIDASPTGLLLIVIGPHSLASLLHSHESVAPSFVNNVPVDMKYLTRNFPEIKEPGQSPRIKLRADLESLLEYKKLESPVTNTSYVPTHKST